MRLALAAGTAAMVALVIALGTEGGGDAGTRALALIPRDASYLHVSTNPDRDQDERLVELATKFPAVKRLRSFLEVGYGIDLTRDVRPWLGNETAVAVTVQGVMFVLAVDDEAKAQGFLTRIAGEQPGVRHRGVVIRRFTGGAAALVDGFLVFGPEPLVRRAIDHASAERPAPELPEGSAVDARLTFALAPFLPAPLREPLRTPITFSAVPTDEGLEVHARQRGTRDQFEPQLLDSASSEALGYIAVNGLDTIGAFLPAPQGAERLRSGLRDLAGALDDEVAVSLSPADPEPVVTLAARTDDPDAARGALADLQGVVAETLVGSEDDTGQVPTFEERDLDGTSAFALRLAGGGELVYAVADDRVAVSNAEDGVREALPGGATVEERFDELTTGVPDEAEALGFLDLRQLLALGDRAGFAASRAYSAVREDLRRIRAAGAIVGRQGKDTTADFTFLIP